MGKTRTKKAEELAEARDRLKRSRIAVFTSYAGLAVSEETKLRKTLRLANAEYGVVKKTLLKLALKELGHDPASLEAVNKPFGVTFGFADESEAAKTLAKFQKDHEMVEFLGGLVEGRFLTPADVKALSKLPTRLELLAQFVRTVRAPVNGFVQVLRGNLTGLMNVLSAVRDQKGS